MSSDSQSKQSGLRTSRYYSSDDDTSSVSSVEEIIPDPGSDQSEEADDVGSVSTRDDSLPPARENPSRFDRRRQWHRRTEGGETWSTPGEDRNAFNPFDCTRPESSSGSQSGSDSCPSLEPDLRLTGWPGEDDEQGESSDEEGGVSYVQDREAPFQV